MIIYYLEFLSLATRQIAPSFQIQNHSYYIMSSDGSSLTTFIVPVDSKNRLLVPSGKTRFTQAISLQVSSHQSGQLQNVVTQYVGRQNWGSVTDFKVLHQGHVCLVQIKNPKTALVLNSEKAKAGYGHTPVNGAGETVLSILKEEGVV